MRLLAIGTATIATLTVALAGCGPAPAVVPPAAQPVPLESLVALVDERLATADTVAAAKWGTRGAVEDPPREQVVLDTATREAAPRGLAPHTVAAVFRDQIQASKVVQYGLFEDWTAEPDRAPRAPPDLAGVRPVLDGITPRLLDALASTAGVRRDPGCATQVVVASRRTADARALDALHRRALDRAVRSLCS